jgi:hypothetical protein
MLKPGPQARVNSAVKLVERCKRETQMLYDLSHPNTRSLIFLPYLISISAPRAQPANGIRGICNGRGRVAIMNEMVPIRQRLSSKFAFQCLRIRYFLRYPWALPARALLRKKLCDEVLVYPGFKVYQFASENSCSELTLVRGAINLFLQQSQLAKKKHLIRSIILSEYSEPFGYGVVDGCCMLNPSAVLRHSSSADSARIVLASQITGAAAARLVFGGSFGYVGLRHLRFVIDIAQIRFLRRCLTRENHIDLLAWMYFHAQDADKRRKNRHYYRLVRERDVSRCCDL